MAYVQPIILVDYSELAGYNYPRGLDYAHWHTNNVFFSREIRRTFTARTTQVVKAPVNQWKAQRADMWSSALTHLQNSGYTPWGYGIVYSIFIQGIPYTTGGLGGASDGYQPSFTGNVVKDGDALGAFAAGVVNSNDKGFLENAGMLAHELMHAFGANNHEDPWGQTANIEWEWWEYYRCVIMPVNKDRLSRSIFFS